MSSGLQAISPVCRVVLVDDDDGVRAVLARMLRKANFEVVEARNGYEGVQQSLELVPDIVVSDLIMPGLDGRGVVRELRKSAACTATPVLILTGSDSPENEEELLALGANDFVSKGASPSVVITRIYRLLGT